MDLMMVMPPKGSDGTLRSVMIGTYIDFARSAVEVVVYGSRLCVDAVLPIDDW